MNFVWKRFLQEVTSLVVHHINELIFLNILALASNFLFKRFRDRQGVHVPGLSIDYIVLVEPADDVYEQGDQIRILRQMR